MLQRELGDGGGYRTPFEKHTGDAPLTPCMYYTDTDDADAGVLPVHDDHLQPVVRRHLRTRDHHHPQHDPGEAKLCYLGWSGSGLLKVIGQIQMKGEHM